MIRRQVGQEYWLITQDDHARISGQLAEQLSNDMTPSSASAILGIALHDCGWPIHDDQPTINADQQPLDVFETPPIIALGVWEASVERAIKEDDYAGLLVSLHTFALSIFATGSSPLAGQRWDMANPRIRFEVNRFQHKIIETQEQLRRRLGMHTDRPLKHGLAENSADPLEITLIRDFRLLQAMDQLSLCICCTHAPFRTIDALRARVDRPKPGQVRLDPWPFKNGAIEVEIPFRRIAVGKHESDEALRAAYQSAAIERFAVSIQPHTI